MAMDHQDRSEFQPGAHKRKRLSTACDRCRRRKVRCDDALPVCSNCRKASAKCVTTNLRNPHLQAQRQEARGQIPSRVLPSPSALTPTDTLTSPLSEVRGTGAEIQPQRDPSGVTTCTYPGPARSQENPTGLFSGPLPAIPRFMSGNSLSVLSQWLDLAFARLGLLERFSWQYRSNGMRHRNHSPQGAEDLESEALAWDQRNQEILDRFMATVNQVFPVLNPTEEIRLSSSTPGGGFSVLGLFRQLVLAAGLTASPNEPSSLPSRTVDAALAYLVPLIQDESIHSINALILMALLFRAQNDSEMAWQMLANAVPKAQSLGLDRRVLQGSATPSYQQRVNTWWALFILDKMLCIELQRPPLIRDHLHDQEMPNATIPSQSQPPFPGCFHAIIRFARIQGRVCDALIACTQAEISGRTTIEQIIKDKVQVSAELDQLLVTWIDELSFDLRPSNYPSCDPDALPAVSFLAIQYYQTLFLIHRNSLIISPKAIRSEIDAHFADKPWRHRILNSPSVCDNVARSIVSVLGHSLESHTMSLLHSIYAPLISVYALAIQIVKNPAGESAKVALEIQASAIRMIEQLHPQKDPLTPTVHTMINSLHSKVAARVKDKSTHVMPGQATEGGHGSVRGGVRDASSSRLNSSFMARDQDGAMGGMPRGTASTIHMAGSSSPDPHADAQWPNHSFDLDLADDAWDLAEIDLNAFALTFDLPS